MGILGGLVGISLGIGFLSALQSRIEGYQDLLVGPPFSVQGSAVEVIVYVVFGLILVLAMGITYDWCQIQKHQQRIKSDFNQLISQLTYREQKALKPNSSIWLPWVAPIFPILYFIDWASTWAGWQFVMMFFIVVWLPYTGYYFWHYKPNTTAWINQAEQTLQKMMSAMTS